MKAKIKKIKDLQKIVESLKKQGKKIVTANGTFDLLHPGHFLFLEKAKKLGDVLIVLVNGDLSVKKFKGDKRPLLSETERALQLTFLQVVDYVTIFSEDKPLKILQILKPQIHAKGGSFLAERIQEEKELMESWGGKLITFPLEGNYSTTNLIKKILIVYHDTCDAQKECPKEKALIFNRRLLQFRPLSQRKNQVDLSVMIDPQSLPPKIDPKTLAEIKKLAEMIKTIKRKKIPIVMAFGAHLIKNGLSLVVIEMMKKGFLNHLLTNGASSVHDWELAYQGKTGEDVGKYLPQGKFGLWEETGRYLNLAINENGGLGYGQAVGKMIAEEKIFGKSVRYPYKKFSLFAQAYALNIPISVCPGIGYDIIYCHPLCNGSAIGQAAYVDFLKFGQTLTNLEGGLYLSIGSAVTSPMVFEKALSMATNLVRQKKKRLDNFDVVVNDLQSNPWNWSKGESPKNNPAYYLRFNKTFSRASKKFTYFQLDNRLFLHHLYHFLVS